MQISRITFLRLYVFTAIIAWAGMTMLDLGRIIGQENSIDYGISHYSSGLATIIFIVAVLLFYKLEIGSRERRNNFVDLLWRSFITSCASLLVLLLIKLFYSLLENTNLATNPLVENFLYHIVIAFFVLYLANLFYLFKRMILFQKTKFRSFSWQGFEIMVFGSLLTCFYRLSLFNDIFLYGLIVFALLLMVLVFNMKWVAYLKFKQKLQSIILLLLIGAIGLAFLQFIYTSYRSTYLILDIKDNLTVVILTCFVIIYCLGSFLVLLFNLPTSSVFEKKFEELNNFQLLSQQIQMAEDEYHSFKNLFETSLGTVLAKAGWLEIFDKKGNITIFFNEGMKREDTFEIKTLLRKNGFALDKEAVSVRNLSKLKFSKHYSKNSYRSLFLLPIGDQGKRMGMLCLIRDVQDGFEDDMSKIIETYVSQTSISVQNSRLLNEAFRHERVKESLKIAEKVQKGLLPKLIPTSAAFELSSDAKSAEVVGGDYFDIFQHSQSKFSVVIGDVSGKGTSAAFHAAQLKGIFHSIVQIESNPGKFMSYANNALKHCLEKDTFITLTQLVIDTDAKNISIARAGHCPTLVYRKETGVAEFIIGKGPALGMFRDNEFFRENIEQLEVPYKPGDVLALYTDGITEANNAEGEEFGDIRLKNMLETLAAGDSQTIIKDMKKNVLEFVGDAGLKDDYTLLIIKFL